MILLTLLSVAALSQAVLTVTVWKSIGPRKAR